MKSYEKISLLHHELSMKILDSTGGALSFSGTTLSDKQAHELLLHLEARLNQVSIPPSQDRKVRTILSRMY